MLSNSTPTESHLVEQLLIGLPFLLIPVLWGAFWLIVGWTQSEQADIEVFKIEEEQSEPQDNLKKAA